MSNIITTEPSTLAWYEPRSTADAMELAKTLAQSDLIPNHYRGKPANIMAVMIKGRELGLSVMQALTEMHIINGKVCSSAALKMGLCVKERRTCVYFRLVESTTTKAVYETQRVNSPEPERIKWDIDDARRANLLNKDTWKQHPAAMLRARCASALATAVYPDLVQGLLTGDEAEDTVDGIYQDPAASVTAVSKTAEVTASLKAQMGATTPSLPPPGLKKMQIIEASKPVEAEFETVVVNEDGEPRFREKPKEKVSANPPPVEGSSNSTSNSQSAAAQAKAAAEKLGATDAKKQTPWERIQELCKEHGRDPKSTMKGIKPGVTPAKLTWDDVALVRDALEASVPPKREEPPPPDDSEVPF